MFLDIIAPWIIESWHEAVAAWSFRLPVIDVEQDVALVAVAAVCTGVLALTIAAIRHLPNPARRAAAALLVPVLLVPAVAATGPRLGAQARAAAGGAVVALWNAAQPATAGKASSRSAARGRELPPQTPLAETRPVVALAPPPNGGSEHPAEIAVVAAVPPAPPVGVTGKPTAAEAAGATIKRLSALLARKLVPRAGTRVIPVLYATDRTAKTGDAGLDYSAAIAAHLSFGRVLVQVPEEGVERRLMVAEIKGLPREEMQVAAGFEAQRARRSANRALIYVPGFNTSFQAAALEAARIADAVQFDGALIIYSWAADGAAVHYPLDVQAAAATVPRLSEFLAFAGRETGAQSVSVIADGLGGGAVVRALAALQERGAEGFSLDQLILCAPDIDRAAFAAAAAALSASVHKITLYADASDRALNISRRYVGAAPRAGDVTESGPVVLAGIDTVDVTEPPFRATAARLGQGSRSHVVLADLVARLAPGAQGYEPASSGLETVTTVRGTYWRRPELAGGPANRGQ